MPDPIYCQCDTPVMDVEHDAGCRRCGQPVNFTPATPPARTRPAYTPDAGDVAVAAKAAATLEDRLRELRAGLVRLSGEPSAAGRRAIEAELDELIGACFASTGRAYFHLTRRLLLAGRRESEPRPLTQADLTRAAQRDAEAGREAGASTASAGADRTA